MSAQGAVPPAGSASRSTGALIGAFVVGMALYGLDGAIFLLVQDWVGVGFHAFALTMMARGYLAARQLSPAHA